MTWVKGATTWANVVDKLTKLACGEVADDSAVTVASGDRWVRTIAGQDLIRSHASKDVALGDMANRLGYMSLLSYGATTNTPDVYTYYGAVCRISNIFTSNPSTTAGRWLLRVSVATANTVSGNYSTASLSYQILDADTGSSITSSSSTPNASGVATLTNGVQVTVSDPSGFLVVSQRWVRLFTTTYVGGIDWWGPLYCKRSLNGLATPTLDATFTVAPPAGVAGTDWDANIDIPVGNDNPGSTGLPHRGGLGEGLGIKTNTALTGGRYVYNHNVALQTMRMVAGSGATNGQISLEVQCGGKVDTVFNNPTYRQRGGTTVATWLRPYQTAASVTSGSAIQYWMSVKADKIVVVLNADSAQTGKLTCAWIGVQTPNFTVDKFPILWSGPITAGAARDYTSNHVDDTEFNAQTSATVWQQARRQDASEGRDWQTGWSRADILTKSGLIGADTYDQVGPSSTSNAVFFSITSPLYAVGYRSDFVSVTEVNHSLVPARQAKPVAFDSKWYLYGFYWADRSATSVSAAGVNQDSTMAIGDRVLRGATVGPVYFIPGDGFTSGDELTDTATSKVYFLVAADYHAVGARIRTIVNTYQGGAAILEE